MGKVNHITMLVSGEQEDAIRSLFKDKNWPCWFKVLTNENVAGLIEGGFTYIFPLIEKDYEKGNNMFTEIKSEVMDVDGIVDDQIINVSKDIIPSCTVDNDDMMNNDMVQKKLGLDLNNNKTENNRADATEDTGGSMSRQIRDDAKSENKLDKRIKCNLCDTTFCKNRKLLKKHVEKRHKGMWLEFECMDCCETFKTKEELWKHRRNANHELGPCISTARKELYTPEELLAVCHNKCLDCNKFYPNKLSLQRHRREVHSIDLPKCTCGVCGAEFKSRVAFWNHMKGTKHNTSPSMLGNYQCDSCVKFFSRYVSLEEHKLTCITDWRTPDELTNLSCSICGLVLKSMLRVKLHKLKVHVGAHVVCHKCGVTCENARAFTIHRQCHKTKNGKYGCDDCGKTFFSNTSLMQHKRTHSKKKVVKMSNV